MWSGQTKITTDRSSVQGLKRAVIADLNLSRDLDVISFDCSLDGRLRVTRTYESAFARNNRDFGTEWRVLKGMVLQTVFVWWQQILCAKRYWPRRTVRVWPRSLAPLLGRVFFPALDAATGRARKNTPLCVHVIGVCGVEADLDLFYVVFVSKPPRVEENRL